MADGKLNYIVRSPEGKEYGPADQDVLIQWAQAGRITAEYEIRNALMQKGNPAYKVPFLQEIIERQELERVLERFAVEAKRMGVVLSLVNWEFRAKPHCAVFAADRTCMTWR